MASSASRALRWRGRGQAVTVMWGRGRLIGWDAPWKQIPRSSEAQRAGGPRGLSSTRREEGGRPRPRSRPLPRSSWARGILSGAFTPEPGRLVQGAERTGAGGSR